MRTLGRLYKRGDAWHICFVHRGQRYRESSGSTKKRVAHDLLKKRIAEVVEGRVLPSADRTSFEDLVALIESDYTAKGNKTARDMRGRVAHLREVFGSRKPIDITYRDLQKYIERRTSEGVLQHSARALAHATTGDCMW